MDLLKAVIWQLICENKLVMDGLGRLKGLSCINISYMQGSGYSPSTDTIDLSLSDIVNYYRLAKKCSDDNISSFQFNQEYLNNGYGFDKSKGVSIYYLLAEERLALERLENTDFLKKKER